RIARQPGRQSRGRASDKGDAPGSLSAGYARARQEARMQTVSARHDVRRMRGGAQSHLMFCSDGCFYVVKFQNNPQGTRVLANELLVSQLANRLGLSTPPMAIAE